MVASRIVEKEIEAQQRIISRLKREIFGVDKTHKSRYIKDFQSEFRDFRAICRAEDAIEKAAACDIVYFGDYHPLEASQDWVLRLMAELVKRGRTVVLALEMLYVHQQEHLDRWMKGAMGEKEFLEKIEYRSEWGFSWESYRRIFALAKDPFIPIFGIDSETRDNLGAIRRRDRLAARRIGTIRSFFPDCCILVVIGESHLASTHLPREVRRVIGPRCRDIVIVQNIDDIYWRLMRRGRENAEAVRIGRNRYCVITASPMIKYRSYRELIDMWVDGDEADRNTPFLHETIEGILSFFVRGKGRPAATFRNGRRESLEAVLPEVQCRTTFHSFSSYLRSRRVSPRGSSFALARIKTKGIAYVPEINTFLVLTSDPGRKIEGAARFVLHLLRKEVGERPRKSPSALDDFYRAVVDEALVCFAARVVNPARECTSGNALLSAAAPENANPASLEGYPASEVRELVRLLRYCIEHTPGARAASRAAKPLRRVTGLGIKKRMLIIEALGARLGEGIHRVFLEGRIPEREILDLLRVPPDGPGAGVRLYRELAGRTRGHAPEASAPTE